MVFAALFMNNYFDDADVGWETGKMREMRSEYQLDQADKFVMNELNLWAGLDFWW